MDETIKELTLLLLYLNAWEEESPFDDEVLLRSWKGYDFDVLNELDGAGMIYDSRKAKSVTLSPAGKAYAEKLLAKYGLSDNADDEPIIFGVVADESKNIEQNTKANSGLVIYQYEKQCWKCGRTTDIITYIVYESDRTNLVYPWNKSRLNEEMSIERTMAHMKDSSIEWYPLLVVGNDEKFDEVLMGMFPEKIKIKYSRTMEKSYPMNVCRHCEAIQGQNYVYRDVNKYIRSMTAIDIMET
jgi:hypothetical protein